MLKLMKYLKKSVGSIVLIIGLLFLQAYCDLLCRITHQRLLMWEFSRRGLRMEYRKKSENLLLNLQLFMSQEDKTEISNAYKQEDGIYVLHDDITKEEKGKLKRNFL